MPELNRRAVIGAGLGVVGAVALGSLSANAATTGATVSRALPTVATPAPLKRSRFTPAIGQSFTAKSATATYTLSLAEILDLPHLAAGYAETCFSLVFSVLEGANPPDDVYRLSNATAGDSTLFASRIGARSDSRQLQAIINQSVILL